MSEGAARHDSALAGKRVVVTRAPRQAPEFARLLRARGAEPLRYPCIDIAPPEDTAPLDEALRAAAAGAFAWLVLTSANTVFALARRLEAIGLTPAGLDGLSVAAIGPATARAAQNLLGLEVDVIPDEYVAEALAEALRPAPGARILLPRTDIARPALPQALRAAGADVTVVTAYRTVLGSGGVDLPALLAGRKVDAITLTSPSTARNLLRRLEAAGGNPAMLADVCIGCIGPITARAARELGLHVAVVADDYTLEGLVTALAVYFRQRATNSEEP